MTTATPPIEVPSKAKLAKATGIALIVALVILFAAVLPAEYGIDPLHTGKALGLLGIAASGEDNSKGRALATPAPGQNGIYTIQSHIYKVESEDFALRPVGSPLPPRLAPVARLVRAALSLTAL